MNIKSTIRSALCGASTLFCAGIAIGLAGFILFERCPDMRGPLKWFGPQMVYADDSGGDHDGGNGGDHDSGGDHDGGGNDGAGGGDHDGGGGNDGDGGGENDGDGHDGSGGSDGDGGGGDRDVNGSGDGAELQEMRDHGAGHDTDADRDGEGNDPADRSISADSGNGSDPAGNGIGGLEGIGDLTPLSKEEEAGLLGNWGNPTGSDPAGSKP